MRPRQIELTEAERVALKESHKFALALTKPRKLHQTQAAPLTKCTFQLLTVLAFKPTGTEAKPRSKEMQELLNSIGETKQLHTNVQLKSSTRAKEVFEKMKTTRRAMHTEALNEYEAWTETFVEGMKERVDERKKRTEAIKKGSRDEIEQLLTGMTDEALLAGNVENVTYVWDKILEIKKQRKEELNELDTSLHELARIKRKSMMEYVTNLKAKLIDIAFVLEPEVVTIIQEMLEKHQEELDKEDMEIDEYLKEQADENQKEFEDYYARWKQKKEQFHVLKQNEAIDNFKKRLNEKYFVNPEERVNKLKELMDYQLKIFNERKQMISTLRAIPIAEITKDKTNKLDEELKNLSESSSEEYKKYFQDYITIQNSRNQEALKLSETLRDFLVKNDANLPEGKTFDMIIEEECTPLIEQRLNESKALFLHVDKYLDEYDTRMHEYSKNIISFYRFIGESYDLNRKDFKKLELDFEVAIANLADNNEDDMNTRDSELTKAVTELRKSVNHISLVGQLEVCYGKLDRMNKEYDKFAVDLKTLIDTQEPKVVTTFIEFEKKLAKHFKMETEESRERIQERLTKETEEKQKKLEEEYLKKQEEEELKAQEQNPTAVKGKAPAKKPAKGKKAEPVLDVPQLEVPKIEEYKSPSGETYLIDYDLEVIADGLMKTEEEIEQQRIEEEKLMEERKRLEEEAAEEAKTKGKAKPKVEAKKEEAKLTEEEEKLRKEEEEKQAEIKAENERKERLKNNVPVDPEANQCLHEKLIFTKEEVLDMLRSLLQQMMEEIHARRTKYIEELTKSNKETIDKNMKDVDKLFQKQWPQKEIIEVDVFQTRQAEIANHKKIYDKHIRSVLKKNDTDEKSFNETVEEFNLLINNYEKLLSKYTTALDDFSNLSELQGYLRKTKEAYNLLTEQVNKFKSDLTKYTTEVDVLLKFNRNFVSSCTLQKDGGTYSEEEKNHYNTLIQCIDAKFVESKGVRQKTIADLLQDAEQRKNNPYNEFEAKYADANSNLAAKEGLGKSFGKPKRVLQDQLKAEMSKCDEAQRGIDYLMEKLMNMMEEYQTSSGSSLLKRPISLSLDIRRTIVTLRNCIVKYADYLSGFKEEFVPGELQRITNDEMKDDIGLTEEELKNDPEVKAEEIRTLGTIGYQVGTDKDITFMAALNKIEENIKTLARSLYQGANAQFLQGDDKIPEYLENYLRTTHAQTNEFRISCIRTLRDTVMC